MSESSGVLVRICLDYCCFHVMVSENTVIKGVLFCLWSIRGICSGCCCGVFGWVTADVYSICTRNSCHLSPQFFGHPAVLQAVVGVGGIPVHVFAVTEFRQF